MVNPPIWCDCCGDIVIAVYPCKFTFHTGYEIPINICLDCMKTGTLMINLPRRNLISIILKTLNEKEQERC